MEGSRFELSAELDSLRSRLDPLLDPEQMERLEEEGRLRNVFRRPGGGPRGRPPREPGTE